MTETMNTTIALLNYYEDRYTLPSNLKTLVNAASSKELPIDKVSRWLGFIQAHLINTGQTTVGEQRDYTRPLFHAAYRADGIEVPPTIGKKEKR